MGEREWAYWWANCREPLPMQKVLWEQRHHVRKAGRRKLRLYACACCRRVWGLLDRRGRGWLERAERISDGAPNLSAEEEAGLNEQEIRAISTRDWARVAASVALAKAIKVAVDADVFSKIALFPEAMHEGSGAAPETPAEAAESATHAALLREVFGNPFRPVTLDPAWLTPTVIQLAHAAYDERHLPSGHLDPARLAVLSDALEEADCVDAAILDHLRDPRPHTRGCWPVDLLLGKG